MLKQCYLKACNVHPPIRRPGSKWGFREAIVPRILAASRNVTTFVEPFVGAGALSIDCATRFPRIVANDLDPSIYSWWACNADPQQWGELISRIEKTTPTKELFKWCRAHLDSDDVLTGAYACIIHNSLAFSGFPTAGTRKKIGSRFNKEELIHRIRTTGAKMEGRLTASNCDFEEVVTQYGQRDDCILYVDCPYVDAGDSTYRVKFNEHERLASVLKNTTATLFVSYDDHEIPRRLYSDSCEMVRIPVTYRETARKKKTHELLFCRPNPVNIVATVPTSSCCDRISGIDDKVALAG